MTLSFRINYMIWSFYNPHFSWCFIFSSSIITGILICRIYKQRSPLIITPIRPADAEWCCHQPGLDLDSVRGVCWWCCRPPACPLHGPGHQDGGAAEGSWHRQVGRHSGWQNRSQTEISFMKTKYAINVLKDDILLILSTEDFPCFKIKRINLNKH